MSHQVLSLKWRPKIFDQVKGQAAVLASLKNSLLNGVIYNCYLFTGTHGVGKTTLARILAKSINCEKGVSDSPCAICETCLSIEEGRCPDVLEIDAASKTKVDDTRELLDSISYAPVRCKFKIYIIDEVHMLSINSFNALLKTIEEPPAHVKFILATTEPKKIPVTILSRSNQYHLKDLSINEITQQLQSILNSEQINFDLNAIKYIADLAKGSMRDALKICEQVISYGERTLTLEACESMFGAMLDDKVLDLMELVIMQNNLPALEKTRQLLDENVDLLYALRKMQSLLFSISLLQIEPNARIEWPVEKVSLLSQIATARSLQVCYQAVVNGAKDLAFVPDQKIGFQMIILRMLTFQTPKETGNTKEATNSTPSVQQTSTQALVTNPQSHARNPINISSEQPPLSSPQITTENVIKQTIDTSHIPQDNTKVEWEKVINLLELKGLTKVIAENCVLESADNNHFKLQLEPNYKPLLNDKIIASIEQNLSLHYNRTIEVSISIQQLTAESPAMKKKQMNEEAQNTIRQGLINNANVIALQQMLDAKLESINLVENS